MQKVSALKMSNSTAEVEIIHRFQVCAFLGRHREIRPSVVDFVCIYNFVLNFCSKYLKLVCFQNWKIGKPFPCYFLLLLKVACYSHASQCLTFDSWLFVWSGLIC